MNLDWNIPSHTQPAISGEPDPIPLLALALIEGIGPGAFHHLVSVFGSPEGVFAASESDLKAAYPRLGVGALIALRRGPDLLEVERQLTACRRLGVRLLTCRSPGYPEPLLHVALPPPVLFLAGEWIPPDAKAMAVVGTRSPSPYGEKSARAFGLRLAEAGWTVVSGLARGVDTLAHEAALLGGSRTLAVLGSGLDCLYPRENEGLARRIAERGCVISEFPMGTQPHPGNFPRRNRIISGLSYGTLVVEAGNDSGSLITAEYAAEQGREVFAVPGPIMAPGTRGTHKLIKAGAHLVDNVDDILNVLSGLSQAAPARRLSPSVPTAEAGSDQTALSLPDPSPEGSAPETPGVDGPSPPRSPRRRLPSPSADLKESHRLLLGLLEGEPRPLEELADRMRALPGRTQLPTHRLLAELLQLEVMGLVRRLPGAVFRPA